MNIYDESGTPQTAAWLLNKYGSVKVTPTGRYAVAELRERSGDAALVVTVLDAAGRPAAVKVAFSWPDAPADPAAGHLGRAVHGSTNADGNVGFGMGPGAYYAPPNQGPHATWIYGGDSDLVEGLGMLAGSNHTHLNVVFQERSAEPEPIPEPEPPIYNRFETAVIHHLASIDGHLEQIARSTYWTYVTVDKDIQP